MPEDPRENCDDAKHQRRNTLPLPLLNYKMAALAIHEYVIDQQEDKSDRQENQ